MGLDVYLGKCPDLKEALRIEELYEKQSEANWHFGGRRYKDLTEEEKEQAREKDEKSRAELGLVKYGQHPSREKIELDSQIHPEHMFKIGYFRSSYNSGGINSALQRWGIPTLYDIFTPNDEYRFAPSWTDCLQRTNNAIVSLTARQNTEIGNYDVIAVKHVDYTHISKPKNEKEALETFERESQRGCSFTSYSNAMGHFYLEGIEIVAALPGKDKYTPEGCTYIICKVSTEDNWYLQALEVVRETIEYVLAQPDKETYYLEWSS